MVLLCKSPSVEVLVIDDGRMSSVKLESQARVAADVDALRKKFSFPRMRILQSALAGDASDRFLPHNHEPDTLVYTNTHDNDTSAGGWATATDHERTMARGYLATEDNNLPWTPIRAAMANLADIAVHPMQDVLALPTTSRMNFTDLESSWWCWCFQWSQVQPWHARRLAELGRLYGRTTTSGDSINPRRWVRPEQMRKGPRGSQVGRASWPQCALALGPSGAPRTGDLAN